MEEGDDEDLLWSPSGKTPQRELQSNKEDEGRELSFSLSPPGKEGKRGSNILDRLKKTKESGVKEVSPQRNTGIYKLVKDPFSPEKRVPLNSLYLDVGYLVDTESVRSVIDDLRKTLETEYGFVIRGDPYYACYVGIVLPTDQTTYYDNDEDTTWVDCRLVEHDRQVINRTLSNDDGTIFFITMVNPSSEFHPLPRVRERVFSYGARFSMKRGYNFLNGIGPTVERLQQYKPGTCIIGQFYEKARGNAEIGGKIEVALEERGFNVVLSFAESSCGAVFIDAVTFEKNKKRILESSKMYNDSLLYRWFIVIYDAATPEDVGGTEGLECYFFSLKRGAFIRGPSPVSEVAKINQKICSSFSSGWSSFYAL